MQALPESLPYAAPPYPATGGGDFFSTELPEPTALKGFAAPAPTSWDAEPEGEVDGGVEGCMGRDTVRSCCDLVARITR